MPRHEDEKLWAEYAKGVKRDLAQKKKAAPKTQLAKTKAEIGKLIAKSGATEFPVARPASIAPASEKFAEIMFNKKTERQLRQGNFDIEARLDLHGMTQAEAYAVLEKFIAAQIKAERRNLLIITGKGRAGKSVLRAGLPRWLEALSTASHILNIRPAAIKHGGEGAFYVILRRGKGQ